MHQTLESIPRGMQILYDGDKLARVPDDVAIAFRAGDRVLVALDGKVLHIPAAVHALVTETVDRACDAFECLAQVDESAIDRFFALFAARLADDSIWACVEAANEEDVEAARKRGRSVTRLAVSDKMRGEMIRGLQEWGAMSSSRGDVISIVEHDGWIVEQVNDGLGVVGFVFEGRPNVFADATGVLRSGNTAILRIGGDALRTARAIESKALAPSLLEAGLPVGAVSLLDSAEHAAAWALFSDRRLSLAVARGSGQSVAQLGGIARQSGIPASLHGTGGAWLVADDSADMSRFANAVYNSLDRKVCNTANVVAIVASRAAELLPKALEAIAQRGEDLGTGFKLHVTAAAAALLPPELLNQRGQIQRASGVVEEPLVEMLDEAELGHEWEWEATPEVSLAVLPSLDDVIKAFNAYSPRFIASLIAEDHAAQARFFRGIDAPFVGDGITRWVDGQYALNRPELGLSNWQHGRLFARGGILSGDGVYTVRSRARQADPDLHR